MYMCMPMHRHMCKHKYVYMHVFLFVSVAHVHVHVHIHAYVYTKKQIDICLSFYLIYVSIGASLTTVPEEQHGRREELLDLSKPLGTWAVLKIMVPFWVP